MSGHPTLFGTATRYALIEHARNRFALALVAVFLPLWTSLTYLAMPDTPSPVRLRATGQWVAPPGNELTAISGALNAVTLIAGFMMFAATFERSAFDRRLALAGYPSPHLFLAKVAALALSAAAVSAYATAVTFLTLSPRQPLLLFSALFCAALTYGALGMGFGSVLTREVEGMFAIVMTSIIDLALQNPVMSSEADSPLLRLLPSYGAMQTGTAAGFSTTVPLQDLAVQLTWFTGATLTSLLVFRLRVRAHPVTPGERSSAPTAPAG
ncbi:ABC transporter permease [Streptomyces massasporeus]|uniref:ABC transporter permease n=1 Tax=Streptomyces massasporeus TaxID=67324 RepID=UPI00364CF0EF